MHTVRNRIASRPTNSTPASADNAPPIQRSSHQELTRFIRAGAPNVPLQVAPCAKGFATGMAVPERTTPAENRTQKRRNPKGKKARKAAARKAATAATSSQRHAKGRGGKQRSLKAGQQAVQPAPAGQSEILLQLCLQAEPALALILPAQAEPLVEGPKPETERQAPEQPEPVVSRVLSLAAMPELLVAAPPVDLQAPAPEHGHAVPPAPAPSAPTLAALADAQAVPLPRSHALVPARRQGLVDVIAFLLRDSGRRLARWSAQRHKSRAERDRIRSAEAHQRALLSEFEALDALRRNRG